MPSEIHQYDIGTRFLITVKDDDEFVDISNASYRQLSFRKPSDTVVVKIASVFNDGSAVSGVMYYDTIGGDLDEVGIWKMQGKIALPSGTYYTDIYSFKVHCNL
jgi:hypothetical protein